MHIPLRSLLIDTVKLLSIGNRSERADCKHLSLSSCEDARAVNSGQNVYLSRKRSDLVNASSIDSLAFIEPVSYYCLLSLIHNLSNDLGKVLILLRKRFKNCILNRNKSCISYGLIICIKCILKLVAELSCDLVHEVMIKLHRLKFKLRLTDLSLNILNKCYHFLYLCVTKLDSLKHKVIRDLISTRLDHYNLILRACNCKVKSVVLSLLESRIEYKLTVNITNIDRSHRAVPRNVRDRDSNCCTDHTCNFRRVIGVN